MSPRAVANHSDSHLSTSITKLLFEAPASCLVDASDAVTIPVHQRVVVVEFSTGVDGVVEVVTVEAAPVIAAKGGISAESIVVEIN